MPQIHLHGVDTLILGFYFLFVIAIGWLLRRFVRTSSDFFISGRALPAWVCGLAFLSANLGAQEVIGMAASGAQYGMLTCHFYWIPAVTAMVFVGIFMMPFYYGSRARSVPEYLKLRFDEKTRGLNAVSFAVMTVFSSGISLFALAKLLEALLGWNFHFSIVLSAIFVMLYILLGGLTSAIYNEVVQFFLIVLGFLPLAILGLRDVGGWGGLKDKLTAVALHNGYAADTMMRVGQPLHDAAANPMGVEWIGMGLGLGFVLAFGYWCTDFLVVQRAMAARSMSAARRTPLIAAVPKMIFPLIVILPGMIAIGLHTASPHGFLPLQKDGALDYNMAMPMMLIRYYPQGMIGLGLTALMASFMSGMAGNVTAFNTVWTYDIYQSYIRPGQPDRHYLFVGHLTTVAGIVLSVGAAYATTKFNNIMNMLQLVFGFVNAPLFGTFLLGMFWRRTTGHGAFYGLLAGMGAAALHHGLTVPLGATSLIKGGWLCWLLHAGTLHTYRSEMAQNFWMALYAFQVCFAATVAISLTTRRDKSDEQLRGLVYSLTPRIREPELVWYRKPATLGCVIMAAVILLNVIFW